MQDYPSITWYIAAFSYPGVIIDDHGKHDINILHRIDNGNKRYYAIHKSFIQ